MPSLRSSPWIRGAPHSGFAMLISRISCRISMWRPRSATARSRFEAPIGSKAGTLPADHSFRADHRQCVKRCRNQSRQPYEQQAIDVVEGHSLWRLAPEHVDLMAKNHDLRLTPCAGPEQSDDGSAKQSEQSTIKQQHHPIRIGSPAVSSFRQGQPQAAEVLSPLQRSCPDEHCHRLTSCNRELGAAAQPDQWPVSTGQYLPNISGASYGYGHGAHSRAER